MAKRISARDKLRRYFLDHVGEVVDSQMLREVAGISEWARRVRELRSQEGMNIQTHNDLDYLKPGQYILVDTKTLPSFERNISKEMRAFVLDRDGFTCQMCGAVAGESHPYDSNRKTRLHMGHIVDKSMGGSDEASNLRAICSVCNEGASNLTLDRPSAQRLLVQVRRARSVDQIEVLRWLLQKYPDQAKQLLDDN